jgi:hypothetical protein
MNCKNVEPLLPLYVGDDLEEEHSRLVAAHVQSCTQCTLVADQYAGASQLLQRYEPPVFSDETYARIREQVLNEIARESHAPASRGIFSQLFSVLVQPRMRWVTAALLLAISVTALYLNRKPAQLPNDRQVAVRSENSNAGASSSFSNKGQVRKATKRRPTTGKRKANAGVVAINPSRKLDKTQPSVAPAPLRVEMQTSNGNIRIIWLSGPRPDGGGTDGSKGI